MLWSDRRGGENLSMGGGLVDTTRDRILISLWQRGGEGRWDTAEYPLTWFFLFF